MRVLRLLALIVVCCFTASFAAKPACADSWMMPSTKSYASCSGHARVTVVPRDLNSQLSYYQDKLDGKEPAGQAKGGARVASARLEILSGKKWHTVWDRQIANEVAPVSAIVRDDGSYVVTFDDWGGVGYGPNAVVVYGANGKLVRALALSDIVPADYIDALPHSVSSIHWRGEPRFSVDGRQVIVPVVIPSDDYRADPTTVDFAIDLGNGAAVPLDPAGWKVAEATGRTVLANQRAAEAAEKAAFIAPLVGPNSNTERAWHPYLREAVGRLIGDDDVPSTTVLRNPDAEDYAISEQWVRDALTDDYTGYVGLATLSEPNLVTVLGKIASKLPTGALSKETVFIALSDQYWPAVVTEMQPTGAKLVQLNPITPIPQRPERIAKRYGHRPD